MLKNLVGEWEFTGSILTDSNGQSLKDPANQGSGILIYTSTGTMAVQLNIPKVKSAKQEIALSVDYLAYYGKYHFDVDTQQVTHMIHNANIAALIGATVTRQVKYLKPGIISLKNTEAEAFGIDRLVFRELFWRCVS